MFSEESYYFALSEASKLPPEQMLLLDIITLYRILFYNIIDRYILKIVEYFS